MRLDNSSCLVKSDKQQISQMSQEAKLNAEASMDSCYALRIRRFFVTKGLK